MAHVPKVELKKLREILELSGSGENRIRSFMAGEVQRTNKIFL